MKSKLNSTGTLSLEVVQGVEFFYSYDTLVAVRRNKILSVTNEKYSNTTSKHVSMVKNTDILNTEYIDEVRPETLVSMRSAVNNGWRIA